MKKVYQSIVSDVDGDCARAVIASLFDLELHEAPPLAPDGQQALNMLKFFESRGYHPSVYNRRPDQDIPTLEEVAQYDKGVNGYFFAGVPSQTFDCVHAVVVDKNLNIVHDPNPNQLCLNLGPEHVIDIWTMDNWVIDLDGNFKNLK